MNWVDWAIVVVLAGSVLFGVFRGLVREVLALAGWIAGIWLALRFAADVGARIPLDLPAAFKVALAGAAIVVGVVIAAALAAWLIGKLLAAVRLSGLDRMLGALFGLLRGALIVLGVVLFAGRTTLAQQSPWRESMLLPHFEAAVRFAAPLLPSLPAQAMTRPA
jgi:membrane protein required for colicin V production